MRFSHINIYFLPCASTPYSPYIAVEERWLEHWTRRQVNSRTTASIWVEDQALRQWVLARDIINARTYRVRASTASCKQINSILDSDCANEMSETWNFEYLPPVNTDSTLLSILLGTGWPLQYIRHFHNPKCSLLCTKARLLSFNTRIFGDGQTRWTRVSRAPFQQRI